MITIGVDTQFRFVYKKGDNQTVKYTSYKKVDDKNVFFSSSPPYGAYDVKKQFQYWDLVWKTLGEQPLN
ncbi:hypothetical protein [Maribacter polysaccharolyticus]|uniref:hypothetical protein n=1 Tax=Maribacter polysaccharolyticus TaxID=3020831 RepID=UPI00237F3BB0|nr:hypothetical protein [Maribacter polysaccharolyticus]MDE3740553.1 hypothetical protein [Maribacter polysaccharolyticus]